MTAGHQHLKNSQWEQAADSFELARALAPAYAPAYIGALCAELKVTEEKLLGEMTAAIDEHPLFKAALEHADPAYKGEIQGYADSAHEKMKAMLNSVKGEKAGDRTVLNINGIEYAFRWCPAGTCLMGSPKDEKDRSDGEDRHQVVLSRGFYLLETEVTQAMWGSVMGNNPSHFKAMKRPVEQVSWNDCQEYIDKLNALGVAPEGYRFSLPTESQWEYACRAETATAYYFGSTLDEKQANFGDEVGQTADAGSYPANAWGLRDMHGNVYEWCSDWYGKYADGALTDPAGLPDGSLRVIRGGCWLYSSRYCRSADRYGLVPSRKESVYGCRLALISEKVSEKE